MISHTAMPAMILAAGYGKRLLPLTQTTPKALIQAGNRCLIEHQIDKLARAGYSNLVINLSWLGHAICAHLGDGGRYGVRIRYSEEPHQPLGSAGGIIQALPLLGTNSFIVTNCDICCDFDYARLQRPQRSLAHLVVVDAKYHGLKGDFFKLQNGCLSNRTQPQALAVTFSGIGCYHASLFQPLKAGERQLKEVLQPAIEKGQVSCELHAGQWIDAGTHANLRTLDEWLNSKP